MYEISKSEERFGFSPQQKHELKEIISTEIEKTKVFENIKNSFAYELANKEIDKETLISKIKEEGLAEEILSQLKKTKIMRGGKRQSKAEGKYKGSKGEKGEKGIWEEDFKERSIICTVKEGSGFTDYYMRKTNDFFQISINLFGKRYFTNRVSASVQPAFNEVLYSHIFKSYVFSLFRNSHFLSREKKKGKGLLLI